jgi:hypothetical protein
LKEGKGRGGKRSSVGVCGSKKRGREKVKKQGEGIINMKNDNIL